MDQKKLNQQSQHWENNFSSKPEMFGLDPSLSAKKALKLFQEKNIKSVIELGAGLGRDTIFFGKNLIHTIALDYSPSGIKVIDQKIKKANLSKYISSKLFDVREKLPFEDNSIDVSRSDVNSSLVVYRIELNFGKSGLYETTLQRTGKADYSETYESAALDEYLISDAPYLPEHIQTVPVYEANNNVKVLLKSSHPAPATLHAMSWEGDYSPRNYRRV